MTDPLREQRTDELESDPDPGHTGEPPGWDRRVAYDRLLSVAKLTPAQACLIALQLLDAADRRGAANGEDPADAHLGPVALLPSGELHVGRPGAGEGTPVSRLVEHLLPNARQLPAHPRPEQLLLLHALEEVARDSSGGPGVRSRELERALTTTLGAGARPRIAGQLGALVEAIAHVAPRVTVPTAAPAAALAPPPVPRPESTAPVPPPQAASRPARSGRARLHRRGRGRRATLALLVVGAVLAASGYVALRGPGVGFVESIGHADQAAGPGRTTSPPPGKHSGQRAGQQPQAQHQSSAVPTLAGHQAGRITGVAVQRTGSCRPGALCPVTVTVHLRPAPASQAISWRVGAARLCKRGITWSPPVTVTAQPGWTTVYAASSVRVPKGRSLALVALTGAPARAQSRPVPVSGSSLRC